MNRITVRFFNNNNQPIDDWNNFNILPFFSIYYQDEQPTFINIGWFFFCIQIKIAA